MTDPSAEPKLQLFPVAIGKYAHHKPIDGIEDEVRLVVEWFGKFGGQPVPWDVPMADRDDKAVAARLRHWSGKPACCTVLYWVGHGWSDGVDASLAHATSPTQVLSFGVIPKNLADHIAIRECPGSDAEAEACWAIVIIDACKSAQFVRQLNAEVDKKGGPRRLLLVSVSDQGSTNLGRVSEALGTIFGRTFPVNAEIELWSLCKELRNELPDGEVIPKNIHNAVLRRVPPPVAVVSPLDVRAEIEAVLSELPREEQRHFVPMAQGAELGELSWYFQERPVETGKIVGWLNSARGGLLVVTGGAGAGKSALLGHLVVQSQPLVRAVLAKHKLADELAPEKRPPDDVFDAVLHLTGLTPLEVTRRLAAGLGLPEPEPGAELPTQVRALCSLISHGMQTRTILLDALDEAVTPMTVAHAVLRPLAALRNLRVVVGTRWSTNEGPDQPESADHNLVEALDSADEIVVVGHNEHAITGYVCRRLDTAVSRGMLVADERAVRRAGAVIGRSGQEFLFARLAVHEILAHPALLGGPELEDLTSGGHLGLFARAVSRLAAERAVNGPLLAALAFARGRGLPIQDGVWAAVATAVSDAGEITGAELGEIDELLTAAAPYVTLDREHGHSVYRLAHRTFARHFTHEPADTDDARPRDSRRHLAILHRLVAEALRSRAAELNPYLRGYLSAHAGAAGAKGWQYLAGHPDVLHRLDPEAVGADVMRTVFGKMEPPPEITGLVGGRHLMRGGTTSDRRGLHQLAMARYAGVRRVTNPELLDGAPWAVCWAAITQQPLHVTLPSNPGGVWALAAVPGPAENTLLASGSGDGVVRLWDLATCTDVGQPMTGHRGGVTAMAILPGQEGRTLLAIGSGDGTVWLWDPATGTVVGEPMTGHRSRVTTMTAIRIHDGRTLLATGSWDGTVWLWDPATGSSVGKPLEAHPSQELHVLGVTGVTALATRPGPDGRELLVSGGGDGVVRSWDLATGAEVGEPLIGHTSGVTALLALAPPKDRTLKKRIAEEQTLLAAGSWNGVVRLWDPVTGTQVGPPLIGRRSGVTALAAVIGPTGRTMLASGSADGVVRRWDPATGTELGQPLTGHNSGVTAVVALPLPSERERLGPNERARPDRTEPMLLASGSSSGDGTVRLWDPTLGTSAGRPLSDHTRAGDAVPTVAGSGWRTLVQLSGRPRLPARRPLASDTGQVYALAVLPGTDGQMLLASGSADGTVRLWDCDSGDPVKQPLTGHTERVNGLVAVPGPAGQTLLASGSDDGTVRLWNPRTGRCTSGPRIVGDAGSVNVMAAVLGAGGSILFAGCGDGTVRVWTGRRWRTQRLLKGSSGQIYAMAALSGPTGQVLPASGEQVLLATGHETGTVRLWDAVTGTEVMDPLRGHTDRVNGVVAFPGSEGRIQLASASADRTVRLWDVATGTEMGQLARHPGAVNAITTLPGHAARSLLASGDSEGTIRLWDPIAGSPVTVLTVGMPVQAISSLPGDRLAIGTPEGIAVLRVQAATVKSGRAVPRDGV
jgi:WD40 repeat protein